MLMTKERLPAIRTLRGWAISVLQDAGTIGPIEYALQSFDASLGIR
jgi:hypothetical protein